MIEGIYKKHGQKVAYILVGAWNTLFGYAIFVLLYSLLYQMFHYIVILVISYIICITNAFLSYKFIVFKTKGNLLREYLRFYVVYGTSFIVNIALMLIIVEFLKVRPIPAQSVILFFITIVSYLGHKHYSFGKPAEIGIPKLDCKR